MVYMGRVEYLQYMKDYGKNYRKVKKRYPDPYLKLERAFGKFCGTDPSEPIVCEKFGCPNHLSKEEQLFGKFCIHHQPQQT